MVLAMPSPPNTLQVADVASELLDGLNLLMQVVALDEVSHLHIFFVVKMGG